MISKKLSTAMFAGLVAVLFTMLPEMANAAATNAGAGTATDILNIITGNIGTLIGLGIALLGLYTWLVQQSSWGVIMIIGGVAVTAFPGLFASMQAGFETAFTGSEASAAQTSNVIVSP